MEGMLAPTPPSSTADITLAINRVPVPPSSMADITLAINRVPTPPSSMADITLAINCVPAPPSSMADITPDTNRVPTLPSSMADITLDTNRAPALPSSVADIMKDLTRPVLAATAPNPVRPSLGLTPRRRLSSTSNDPRMHEENWVNPRVTPPFRKTRSLSFNHLVDLDLGISNGQVINRARFANGSLDNCLLNSPTPYRPKYVSTPGGDIVSSPAPRVDPRSKLLTLW